MEHSNDVPANKWVLLGTVLTGLLVVLLEVTAVTNGIETIAPAVGADASGAGWILKAYLLSFAVLLLIGGKLSDLFGRRKTLLAGLAVLAVGSVAAGAASNEGWLIGFRALQGAGAALVLPATLALILDTFPRRQRGAAFGWWTATLAVALAGGIALSGLAIDALSWRWIFYGNAILSVLAILFTFRFVAGGPRPERRGFDVSGALTVTGGLAALGLAVLEGSSTGWDSPLIIALFALAASQLLAFVLVDRRQTDPLINLSRFRTRNFGVGSLIMFLASGGILGGLLVIALQLEQVLGYSSLDTAVALLPLALVILVVAPMAGRLLRRFDQRWLVAGGLLSVSGSLWWLSTVEATSTRVDLLLPLALFGLGTAVALPALINASLDDVPGSEYGTAAGAFGAARTVGVVVGVAVATSLFVSQIDTQVPKALADNAKSQQGTEGQTGTDVGTVPGIKSPAGVGTVAGTGVGTGTGTEQGGLVINLLHIDEPGAGLSGTSQTAPGSAPGIAPGVAPGAAPVGPLPRAAEPLPVLGTIAQAKLGGTGALTQRQQEKQQKQAEEQQKKAEEQTKLQEVRTESAIDEGLSKAAGNTFRYLSIFTLLGVLATIYLGRSRAGRSGESENL
ncbi:MAG: DHA2 family efflux MFS transporter permease subunit [bacterium]|nr:DHA2 family efflux MFS transporter permease subunit [bacterium]MDZ4248244.1 DHA2 family efflux MFS transporter permease subunit [Patescibacteria group bacterium]